MTACLFGGPLFAQCNEAIVDLKGDWGQARFSVEIADDPEEQARGLMFRETLPLSHGMLFLYESPRSVAFWMENTLIPLDMLFIGPDGRVARIHENAIPKDRTVINGGRGIQAVLEINGGLARKIGIEVGSAVRHPAFDPSGAAWPCD